MRETNVNDLFIYLFLCACYFGTLWRESFGVACVSPGLVLLCGVFGRRGKCFFCVCCWFCLHLEHLVSLAAQVRGGRA